MTIRSMRQVLSFGMVVVFALSVPCHAQNQEQSDLTQQLRRLNSILALMVRAEVISQKLSVDQTVLRELISKRDKLDADVRQSSRQNYSESQLAELEKGNPELARHERAVLLARETQAAELRSSRDDVDNDIRSTTARIDNSLRRLEAIDQQLNAIAPEEPVSKAQ